MCKVGKNVSTVQEALQGEMLLMGTLKIYI